MKKKDLQLKEELLRLCRIPPSREKAAFFRSSRWLSACERAFFSPEASPGISFSEFLRIQAGYIRLRNWLFSLALFLGVLLFSAETVRGAGINSRQFLGALSACIPYLALTTMAEGSRSVRFGMDELEMHTRFSLHAVICARLFLTGAGNLLVLTALIPFLCTAWGTGGCFRYPSHSLSAHLRPGSYDPAPVTEPEQYRAVRRSGRRCQRRLPRSLYRRTCGIRCLFPRRTSGSVPAWSGSSA